MQLRVYHKVDQPLVLPLGYHHIVQSVLFRTLEAVPEYSGFLHDRGYEGKTRTFKLFTFGLLQGAYQIQGKNIVFTEDVSFEIRSIDPYMLKLLKEGFEKKGITYLGQTYREVSATLNNEEVDETELTIRMVSPVCVYSTDREKRYIITRRKKHSTKELVKASGGNMRRIPEWQQNRTSPWS